LLGLLTLVGFSLIGLVIRYFFSDEVWYELFLADDVISQTIYGSIYGIIAAMVAWRLINIPYLKNVKGFYSQIISELDITKWEVVFISFCAGIGEEILFRGAIQEYLGIWITSILFVAIHGYLNPKNMPVTVYGIYMTLIIVVLGWAYEEIGLYACIAAHTVIDIILLTVIKNKKPESLELPKEEI